MNADDVSERNQPFEKRLTVLLLPLVTGGTAMPDTTTLKVDPIPGKSLKRDLLLFTC